MGIGRLAEWLMAAVLKTVDLNGFGGSNPSPSANNLKLSAKRWAFFVQGRQELDPVRTCAEKLKGRKAVSFKSFARAPAASGEGKGTRSVANPAQWACASISIENSLERSILQIDITSPLSVAIEKSLFVSLFHA